MSRRIVNLLQVADGRVDEVNHFLDNHAINCRLSHTFGSFLGRKHAKVIVSATDNEEFVHRIQLQSEFFDVADRTSRCFLANDKHGWYRKFEQAVFDFLQLKFKQNVIKRSKYNFYIICLLHEFR